MGNLKMRSSTLKRPENFSKELNKQKSWERPKRQPNCMKNRVSLKKRGLFSKNWDNSTERRRTMKREKSLSDLGNLGKTREIWMERFGPTKASTRLKKIMFMLCMVWLDSFGEKGCS